MHPPLAHARKPVLERYLARCSLIVGLCEAPGHAGCEHDEHAALADCIAAGDGEEAARCMEKHLRALEHRVDLRRHGSARSLAQMLGL